jgi:glutaredoxin
MKDIQVWGSPHCSFCTKAKELLENHKFEFDYYDALENPEKFNTLFPDAKTVPQIIFRGERVGGYDGLIQTFENQNIFIGGGAIV